MATDAARSPNLTPAASLSDSVENVGAESKPKYPPNAPFPYLFPNPFIPPFLPHLPQSSHQDSSFEQEKVAQNQSANVHPIASAAGGFDRQQMKQNPYTGGYFVHPHYFYGDVMQQYLKSYFEQQTRLQNYETAKGVSPASEGSEEP